MKKITKSVIKLSEIPKYLQNDNVFVGHKLHTYAEFHIDSLEQDSLTLWLIAHYPTIKQKISFLIHIDIEIFKELEKEHIDNKVIHFAEWITKKHIYSLMELYNHFEEEFYNEQIKNK